MAPALRRRSAPAFSSPSTGLTPVATVSTGGFGLGLAIVRRIALLHGGQVRLDSSSEGGARFVISLPAMDEPAMPGKPAS